MADELIFYTNPMSRGQIVRWMLEDALPARFQLQLHKHVGPPSARGV